MSVAIMAKAPALIGDCKIGGNDVLKNILATISTTLKIKENQQAALVTFFEYSE